MKMVEEEEALPNKILSMAKLIIIFSWFLIIAPKSVVAVEILSKSRLEKCEKVSESDNLNCTRKIVLNMAVPSNASGLEASIVAEVVEVEENSTNKMQTLRVPPVITVNKSDSYALYELKYIRDVPYKPQESFVKTRKCESDAGADVVKTCERLRDENGHIIEHTQPVCCPCGPQRRVPSSCGNFFGNLVKGKANTAHCVRFPGDWFHVYSIGQRTIGFTVRLEIKMGSKVLQEVIVDPGNRTAISNDKLLRVNLIGDFVGYTSIPSFENFYLVIPRQGEPGQPQNLGTNYSMWMLLESVRFTLDGSECNKIGVSYEAFNAQPNFCSSPFWSCLHNQLWNFRDYDQNRMSRERSPLYGLERRFERINQHPDAGTHSLSIGVTEALNTNILIELSANDIEYVYQRSPGKILTVTIPTFEALMQLGVATITAKNTGEVEASYSLTFDCSKGIGLMEEQFLIMKPNEIASRSFKINPSTHQAAKYKCAAILKDAEFSEVDRAECQFSTTATVYDNGSQMPFQPPEGSIIGFFNSIESVWNKLWYALVDFITGKTCRSKCKGFFDFSCHIQYICMSWMVMFGLLLAIFPTVVVLLWLLHQKGLFDPLYDWWEDHFSDNKQRPKDNGRRHNNINIGHPNKPHEQKLRHHKHHNAHKRRSGHHEDRHNNSGEEDHYQYYLHHVHKDKGKKHSHTTATEQRRHKEKKVLKGPAKLGKHGENG